MGRLALADGQSASISAPTFAALTFGIGHWNQHMRRPAPGDAVALHQHRGHPVGCPYLERDWGGRETRCALRDGYGGCWGCCVRDSASQSFLQA